MEATVDVAVVGGGVIGCSVAHYTAQRGAKVALVEAEQIGTGASGQTVGLLAAQGGRHEPGPFLDLLLQSRGLYEPLSQELYELTGLDVEYIRAGTLQVATDAESAGDLAEVHSRQREQGLLVEWLEASEVYELEPNLAAQVVAALYAPEDAQVNPPRLVQALAFAASLRRTQLMEAVRVTGLVAEKGKVTGVRTAQGTVSADTVVLASGVLSPLLLNDIGVNIPVFPVKGEIITVNARPIPIKTSILSEGLYLVPKRDGRVVIGSTEAPYVHDRRPTLGGIANLSQSAVLLLPELSNAPFMGAWGGLRPGTSDGHPILGPVGEWENLLIATGHYRNGVLLAPITGQIISALALGESPPIDVSPFTHDRFVEE
jgi:glycine oxidase